MNRELGIETLSTCEDEQKEMLKLAETMFDTKLPPGVTMLQPFSEESSIKKIAVQVCLISKSSQLMELHVYVINHQLVKRLFCIPLYFWVMIDQIMFHSFPLLW